jgi:hypothetical protein
VVARTDKDAALKQFEVLWTEIARRSNAQQALIGLSVTVTGTVGGLVVTGKSDPVLLVVLAIVSPVLGLLWIDHARNIGDIAEFIRTKWTWEPNWETHIENKKRSAERFIFFILAMGLTFLSPAVAGLIASGIDVDGAEWVAWSGAALLTALFAIGFGLQVWRSRPWRGDG